MDIISIYSELRRRIDETGMTQAAIADALCIPQSSISRFKAEKTGLQADVFLKLLLFVGGSISFGNESFDDTPCIKERDELRKENERLKQHVLELETEVKIQQRLIDRAYPPAPLSFSAGEEKATG